MKIVDTKIPGLCRIEIAPINDCRGSFARLFCANELAAVLGERRIVQVNRSLTAEAGTVRGLHFQRPPHAEMKLVRCTKGRVWDVAVDLRAGSKTFLEWHAEELTAENDMMMAVPEGFAHGFQALDPGSELLYLTTAFYAPKSENGVRFDDPALAISWPLPVGRVSDRDRQHPLLDKEFMGVAA